MPLSVRERHRGICQQADGLQIIAHHRVELKMAWLPAKLIALLL